jgi:hypothetical protein
MQQPPKRAAGISEPKVSATELVTAHRQPSFIGVSVRDLLPPPNCGGRPTTTIDQQEIADWATRFPCVDYTELGVSIVHDELTGERFRYPQFIKRFGAKAARYLASPDRRRIYSERGWKELPPVEMTDAAKAIMPLEAGLGSSTKVSK